MTRSSSTAEPFHRIVSTVALAITAMFVVGIVARELLPHLGLRPAAPAFTLTLPIWVHALATVTVLPMVEETLFRGWLISWLRRPLGFWNAALVANCGWVAAHLPTSLNSATIQFALGLILAVVRWRTDSVAACIVTHAGYNLAPALLMLMFLI